jgi:S-adenosylmethionine decarboxylase
MNNGGTMSGDDLRPFGYGLYIDLYNCDPAILDDIQRCYQFLDDLVAELKMSKQSPPYIFRSPAEYPDKAGLSGWVPLIESGIQIHTLVPKRFASLDIYTCGIVHQEKTVALAQEFFQSDKVEIYFLNRGIEYNLIQ